MRGNILVLFLILAGKLLFSHHYDVGCRFFVDILNQVEDIILYS